MELFKRDRSSSWYVDLAHPTTGERLRRSLKFTGSKVEAQKRARKLEAELEAEVAGGGLKSLTLKQALDSYIEALDAQGKDPSDARYRRDRLLGLSPKAKGRWTLPPDTPFHDLQPATMEKLVLARMKEGKRPQTIKHELGLLKAAANYAERWGFTVPADMKKWPVPAVGQKTRYLSPEEFARVVAYLDPDRLVGGRPLPPPQRAARTETRDLTIALAYTGGRWSEIANLPWDKVNLARGTITLWGGKTQRERVVPIAAPLQAVLGRRKATRGPSPLVFPGPAGRPRSQPCGGIGAAMDAVGLNPPDLVARHGRATIHSLRHTFASWLIQNGADIAEVSGALGHTTLVMTQRYAHLSKSATITKLGGILNHVAPH